MIRLQIVVRAAARRDIEAQYRWFLTEAGVEVADRFLENADRAFSALAAQPNMGPATFSDHPRLALIRKWKIEDFPSILIFYEPRPNGISVVRVIHAAQNWWALIGIDRQANRP